MQKNETIWKIFRLGNQRFLLDPCVLGAAIEKFLWYDFQILLSESRRNFDKNSNYDVWYEFLKDWHANIDSPFTFHAEAQANLEILKAIDLCILSNENLITVTN